MASPTPKLKKLLPLLGVVLVAVIVFALYQMDMLPFGGSGDSPGTTVTTKAVAGGGSGSGSTDTTGAGATTTTLPDEAQSYLTAMNDWAATYWEKANGSALNFKKILAPTSKELQRATDYVNAMHASLAALKGIQAPQEVASVHARFTTALSGEVTALDRLVRALKSKNSRDIELAFRSVDQWQTIEAQAEEILGPYLNKAGGIAEATTPSTSTTVVGDKVTFSDSTHGVSLVYPRTWTPYSAADLGLGSFDVPPGTTAFAIGDPTAGSFENRPIYYMIVGTGFAGPGNTVSAAAALNEQLTKWKSEYSNLSVVSPVTPIKVNGLDGATLTVSHTTQINKQSYKLMSRFVYVRTADVVITLHLLGEKDKWTAETKVMDAMVDSIKVTAPAPAGGGVTG